MQTIKYYHNVRDIQSELDLYLEPNKLNQEVNKMKMHKSIKSLKTEDFAVDQVVIENAVISGVEEIDTEYGKRKLVKVNDLGEDKTIFLNQLSIDLLIDQFGEETEAWFGEQVKVVCEKGKGKFKNPMFVITPIKN